MLTEIDSVTGTKQLKNQSLSMTKKLELLHRCKDWPTDPSMRKSAMVIFGKSYESQEHIRVHLILVNWRLMNFQSSYFVPVCPNRRGREEAGLDFHRKTHLFIIFIQLKLWSLLCHSHHYYIRLPLAFPSLIRLPLIEKHSSVVVKGWGNGKGATLEMNMSNHCMLYLGESLKTHLTIVL